MQSQSPRSLGYQVPTLAQVALSATVAQLCVTSLLCPPSMVQPLLCKSKPAISLPLVSSRCLCSLSVDDGMEGTVCFCYLRF